MDDKFKDCSKCFARMNVLDEHNECYRHRLCNKEFPCEICEGWTNDKRAIVEKMVEKTRSKVKSSTSTESNAFCVGGTEKSTSSVNLTTRKDLFCEGDKTSVQSSQMYEAIPVKQGIDVTKFIQDQIREQLDHIIKSGSEVYKVPVEPESRSNPVVGVGQRLHYSKFLPADDQLSVADEGSEFNYSNTSGDRVAPVVCPEGAPTATDPLQWNRFVEKMANTLNIECSTSDQSDEVSRTSYLSSRLLSEGEGKSSYLKLPMEGKIVDVFKDVEREAVSGKLRSRSVRARDDKAFMVDKEDFNAFCSPPRLDENIEEGLSATTGNFKKNFGNRNSRINLSPFQKEMDADFKKIDVSARVLLRSISYGTMISGYIDTVDNEEDRVEGCRSLIACFKSMADMTTRIIANSVLSRRKIFLRNVEFTSKATPSKLLNLPIAGPQLFGGKYFSTLHSSAENIRDARETQNVYRNTGYKTKNDNNSKKRKVQDVSTEVHVPVKVGKFSHGQEKKDVQVQEQNDNFRSSGKGSGKGSFLWKSQLPKSKK